MQDFEKGSLTHVGKCLCSHQRAAWTNCKREKIYWRKSRKLKRLTPVGGSPDIFVKVEVASQEALTRLVLTKIHAIEGVAQTDTHLVYTLHE